MVPIAGLQFTELTAEVSNLKQQLQQQQDKTSAAAAKQASAHEQQLQQLQQRLQAAVSKGASQYAEALDSAGQLRGRVRELEGELELMKAERDALQVRHGQELRLWSACWMDACWVISRWVVATWLHGNLGLCESARQAVSSLAFHPLCLLS